MLPLGILNAAQGFPMLIELKNGEVSLNFIINSMYVSACETDDGTLL